MAKYVPQIDVPTKLGIYNKYIYKGMYALIYDAYGITGTNHVSRSTVHTRPWWLRQQEHHNHILNA